MAQLPLWIFHGDHLSCLQPKHFWILEIKSTVTCWMSLLAVDKLTLLGSVTWAEIVGPRELDIYSDAKTLRASKTSHANKVLTCTRGVLRRMVLFDIATCCCLDRFESELNWYIVRAVPRNDRLCCKSGKPPRKDAKTMQNTSCKHVNSKLSCSEMNSAEKLLLWRSSNMISPHMLSWRYVHAIEL